MKVSRALLITGVVWGLATGSARAGSGGASPAPFHSQANAQFIIKRAANFGNQSNISLYIDGHRVGTLSYGRSYQGMLPAGRHFVTLKQTPHLNDAYPFSQQWIRLAPGRPAIFTAIWKGGGTRIALEES